MNARRSIALIALAIGSPGAPSFAAAPLPLVADSCAAHAPEAASRSGLAAEMLLRVMRAESGGTVRAVSSKGAMGCMQIMSATWAYLSRRYGLGTDPFDPRMNMIGGAMYLAELAARYGFPGAFAAYNAGPGRYERYAAGSATLPAETIAYIARIGPVGTGAAPAASLAARWQEASLFMLRAAAPAATGTPATSPEPTPPAPGPMFPLSGQNRGVAAANAGP